MKGGYVDGYVLVVPKKKLAYYRRMAAYGEKMWRKAGAIDYKECVGEDMKPNMGGMKLLTFPKMAKTKGGEVVVFSYILFKSRAHRDAVNKKVMAEMMKDPKNKDMVMPFDMKRMAYGGFKVIVGH
ncbi:MAG: DUF1428 domain-containing protein [Candidatus Micrarchaeota archaeon]